MSMPIRISQRNWDRIQALTGPHGTADEKVGAVLDLAGNPGQVRTEAQARGRPKTQAGAQPGGPAWDLHAHLQDHPWFHSVGDAGDHLIVYVKGARPRRSGLVPETWAGLAVSMQNIGRIVPLNSAPD